ncbi:MAG: PAS domain-containing protein [Alphaproteobacteria bacterium]|nr:PAS domain-containing protein [Alphaproteobacteria bacterium]
MNLSRRASVAIPDTARLALASWRGLRQADGTLPLLGELAPAELPRGLLPWTMTIHRDAQRALVYGVVGERIAEVHGSNPRGRTFLYNVPVEIAEGRRAIVHRALDTGTPIWVVSRSVRADNWMHFGRIGLPTRTVDGHALIVILFRIPADDAPEETGEHLEWLDPIAK